MKHYREKQMGDIKKKSKRGLGIEQGHGGRKERDDCREKERELGGGVTLSSLD